MLGNERNNEINIKSKILFGILFGLIAGFLVVKLFTDGTKYTQNPYQVLEDKKNNKTISNLDENEILSENNSTQQQENSYQNQTDHKKENIQKDYSKEINELMKQIEEKKSELNDTEINSEEMAKFLVELKDKLSKLTEEMEKNGND